VIDKRKLIAETILLVLDINADVIANRKSVKLNGKTKKKERKKNVYLVNFFQLLVEGDSLIKKHY